MFGFFKPKFEKFILEVSYQEKEEAKSFGALWDPNLQKWYAPSHKVKTKCEKWWPLETSLDAGTIEEHAKIILYVPFNKKDEAKALGARWDPSEKTWYAPTEAVKQKCEKWLLPPEQAISNVTIPSLEEVVYLIFKQIVNENIFPPVFIEGLHFEKQIMGIGPSLPLCYVWLRNNNSENDQVSFSINADTVGALLRAKFGADYADYIQARDTIMSQIQQLVMTTFNETLEHFEISPMEACDRLSGRRGEILDDGSIRYIQVGDVPMPDFKVV